MDESLKEQVLQGYSELFKTMSLEELEKFKNELTLHTVNGKEYYVGVDVTKEI